MIMGLHDQSASTCGSFTVLKELSLAIADNVNLLQLRYADAAYDRVPDQARLAPLFVTRNMVHCT